ncbi:MAG: N-acetyltransferase [Chloroflexi bacterium]|nr:N-acetyltransferase [Chloroflexota bacterium]
MLTPAVLTLRQAEEEDRSQLTNLLHFETYVHRHLDWRRPLDWLGKSPFLVGERSGRLSAALACPPDPSRVAWLRLFAVGTREEPENAWRLLWPAALEKLAGKAEEVVAIPVQGWIQNILSKSNFEHTHDVVVLDWHPSNGKSAIEDRGSQTAMRVMRDNDIASVFDVDRSSFPALWQNSKETIHLALEQAAVATVVEVDGRVVAYQISTMSSQGLHLARLAVHPDYQGRHFALSLVADLQERTSANQEHRLSVNTQDINTPSLGLYERAGFKRTGEAFPVYQMALS